MTDPMDAIWIDPGSGLAIANQTDTPNAAISAAFMDQHPELASLVRWGNQVSSRSGGIWNRERYVTPDNIYDQFRTAYDAVQSDDVVAGVLEMSEALAFNWMDFEAEEPDEANVWNQIAEDTDLILRIKEIWRDLFTLSQAYVAVFWGRRSYRVNTRGITGNRRKKIYDLVAPIGLSVLDPMKIIPVGNFMFGQEQLAYIATRGEAVAFDKALADSNTTDAVVQTIMLGRYEPNEAERQLIGGLGVDVGGLYLLDPDKVWRITATRASYERFAVVRMKSVFELLDLKNQLRAMDRAHLLGATNFIILVKKGSDKQPGRPEEIRALQGQMQSGSRVPLIVGDQRLSIEIITPKTDMTLKPERYNTIDARIESRLFGMFQTGNYASGAKGDDSIKLAKIVARGLESRRADVTRSLHRRMIMATVARNDALISSWTRLQFHPKRISIDLDPTLIALLQDLRDRGDLSRESILDEVGYEQGDEARKRDLEREFYDESFSPVNVPFDSPNKGMTPAEQKIAGRTQGGNRNGGGANAEPKMPKGSLPKKPGAKE